MRKDIKKAAADTPKCGECSVGKWVTEHMHLDMHGKPIAKRCKYRKYLVLRTEPACENFKR